MGTKEMSDKEYNDFASQLKQITEHESENKEKNLNELYEKIE